MRSDRMRPSKNIEDRRVGINSSQVYWQGTSEQLMQGRYIRSYGGDRGSNKAQIEPKPRQALGVTPEQAVRATYEPPQTWRDEED